MNASCRGFVQPADVKGFTSETKKSLLAKVKGKNLLSDFGRAVKEICEADEGLVDSDNDDSQEETEEATNQKVADYDVTDKSKGKDTSAGVECKQADMSNKPPKDSKNYWIDGLNNDSTGRNEKPAGVRSNVTQETHKKRRKIIVSDEDSDSQEDLAVNIKTTVPNQSPEISKSHIQNPDDKADLMDKEQIQDEIINSFASELSHSVECVSDIRARKSNASLEIEKTDACQSLEIGKSTNIIHGNFPEEATQGASKNSAAALDFDEELHQQTLLPKKKRRASQKLELRVVDSESEKQLNSIDSHALEQEVQVKGIVSEYQRRKRVPDLSQEKSEFRVWLFSHAKLYMQIL